MAHTVLIVDDSPMMRLMIRESLAADGWIVLGEACDGHEAVKLYRELHPDVVTMDIVMPGMTGIEALAKIRAEDPNANVVMVSALSQTRLISQAIRSGAADFIVKPFSEEDLQETVRIVAEAAEESVAV
jgi:two-component system chemotaxis response regulator CheY